MGEPEGGITAVRAEEVRLCRDDVDRAGRRLVGKVWRTPVVRCDHLDALAGTRLWMKAENLQRGGSFKIRGALLAVERLAAAGSRGVVAQSTGNPCDRGRAGSPREWAAGRAGSP
jgi:threonine dehydratase